MVTYSDYLYLSCLQLILIAKLDFIFETDRAEKKSENHN